ncbi:hypothetical protein TPHA_0M01040 [Tetrapisispora phaffii CBS 4417]|uniref:Zn(2)-C6 fungal-type domain-containing protein n=1 Tax=Tetrapisispora phaffii (strain ATCC 24235 / CBS 4417 / NBRC 1672 / NRRL Y-8282 / UCD 70-5) TaxID=1071381 RepID=G8C0G3_TETPH|nr:hypothetical protein TPHA_0M01040 [Tetrapisispora phaffii CBS 4417]CCE65678.1 hypothetical protein TPHA_0M01040 [Tetrapisispora phaffii CBS 4417]
MISSEDKSNNTSPGSNTSSERRDTYNSNSVLGSSNSTTPLYTSNISSISSVEKIDPSILSKSANQNANKYLDLNSTALGSVPSSNTNSPNDLSALQSAQSDSITPDPLSIVSKLSSTSVSSTSKDSHGNPIKRKYSRNGCTECKRRRMKCDETKPTCWQCSRLNRHCVYVFNPKNKKRNKDLLATALSSNDNEDKFKLKKTISGTTSISSIKSESKNSTNSLNYYSDLSISNSKENISNSTDKTNTNKIDETLNYNANLLIQNLNDIVNMKLNDSITLNEGLKDLESFELDIPELLNGESPSSSIPISFQMKNVITFNTELTALKLDKIHEKYLKMFYYDCMDSIAPFFQDQSNPLRDIILSFAKSESYLLSAVLSVGASIYHRKTNDIEDEKNYCQYLSHCLRFLDEQFQTESNVIDKIEPIILTVILLAWDCIYTMNSQWRSHLKGIIDLFKKINAGNSSKIINVAKSWFKIMETFASISTNFGGSLTDESDIDLIFDPYDYQYTDSLKYLNIMTPVNEFNLLRGHKEDFDIVIKEVIKALNKIRDLNSKKNDNKKIVTGQLNNLPMSFQRTIISSTNEGSTEDEETVSYFTIQKILVEIDRQLDYEFISKTGVIAADSPSHPNNSEIKDNAIDTVVLANGHVIAVSWYDISHQTQVLSFLLIVLLKILKIPKESSSVQEICRKIMSFFKFLESDEPPTNRRTCYSNFAVLLAGLNTFDENTRTLIRKYYNLNINSGFSRLSEHSMNRLEKVWAGNDQHNSNHDIVTW